MHLTGIARLGRDAEVRFTPSGQQVANLALAFNYGRRGDDGNRPTQWVDASLWGDRAEKLAPYLTKGQTVYVMLEEPHIETYEGKNGTGAKMVARVASIEFAGSKPDGQQQQAPRQSAPPQQAPRPQQAPTQNSGGGFGDFGADDIPFDRLGRGFSIHAL